MPFRPVLLASVLAAALSSAGTLHAQSQSAARSMAVSGNTPEICAMQPGSIQTGSLVNINGLDGDTLRIAQFTDPRTLAVRPAHATIRIEAVCNFAHRVRVESENNGLWPTDGAQTVDRNGFTSAVPYVARLRWGGVSDTLTTDGRVRRPVEERVTIDRPSAGTLELQVDIAAGASNVEVNAPVLAGSYGDTLRIILEPR